MRDDFAHNTRKIRQVANKDITGIVDDIKDALHNLEGIGETTSQAFKANNVEIYTVEFPFDAFSGLGAKWEQNIASISEVMKITQSRVEKAIVALRANAKNYDDAEARNIANFQNIQHPRNGH